MITVNKMSKVEIKVNDNQVPLNKYVNTLVSKLVLAIVDSLKGIDDKDVEKVIITVTYD